jgi:hypothetical protein
MNFLECSHHYCFVRVIDDVLAVNSVEKPGLKRCQIVHLTQQQTPERCSASRHCARPEIEGSSP